MRLFSSTFQRPVAKCPLSSRMGRWRSEIPPRGPACCIPAIEATAWRGRPRLIALNTGPGATQLLTANVCVDFERGFSQCRDEFPKRLKYRGGNSSDKRYWPRESHQCVSKPNTMRSFKNLPVLSKISQLRISFCQIPWSNTSLRS